MSTQLNNLVKVKVKQVHTPNTSLTIIYVRITYYSWIETILLTTLISKIIYFLG